MITQQSPHPPVTLPAEQGNTAMPDPDDPSARAAWAAIRQRCSARTLAGFGASVLLSTVLPLIFYERVRHLVGSQVTALLIATAIPVAWTVGKLAVRRRLDPIGLLSVAGFAIGILMLVVTGSTFAFKIHGAVLTGAIGVVCLASMAIRRPLGLLLMPTSASWPGMTRRTAANWLTGIWGAVLVTDAAVITMLAATLPTRTFLAVHTPVAWSFIALGFAGVIWRRQHRPATRSGTSPAGRS
jgi:hypothetical protein